MLTFAPPILEFGNVSVTSGPVSSTLTITNSGGSTLISGFVLGSGGAEFSITAPTLPRTLSNGGSLTIEVTYDPNNRGTDYCTVTVTDDNLQTDTFGLGGTGVAAALQVSPTSLAFDDQAWSSGTGQTLQLMLANVGELPIEASNLGSQLTNGSHFTIGAPVGLPIGPGEFAMLPVTFDPASAGAKVDLLTLALDNDAPLTPNVTVSLSGAGLEETAGVGPASSGFALAAGPSPTRGMLAVRYSIPHGGRVALEVCDLSDLAGLTQLLVAGLTGIDGGLSLDRDDYPE